MDTQPASEPEVKHIVRSNRNKPGTKTLSLNIPEKLLILTIDDDKGAIASSVKKSLRYGLSGALLAELVLIGKIQLDGERLKLAEPSLTNDTLFDNALKMVAAEKKKHKLTYWVNEIGSKTLLKQVAGQLAGRGVIKIEKKRFSWIYPYIAYPQVDASAKYWVKQNLRAVVLAGEKAKAADIALLSLLKACSLLRLLFTSDERKAANKKVDRLVQGEAFGNSVSVLLADVEAATAARVAAK